MNRPHVLLAALALMTGTLLAAQDSLEKQLRQAEGAEREGRLAEAVKLYDQILKQPAADKLKELDRGHLRVRAGRAHANQDNLEVAKKLLLEALTIYERSAHVDPEHVAVVNDQLGKVCRLTEEFDQAEKHYKKALALRLAKFGPNDWRVGLSWHNLGVLAFDRGDYDAAAKFYQDARAVIEKAVPQANEKRAIDLALADVLDGSGVLARHRKRLPLALVDFLRAHQLRRQHLHANDVGLATSLNHLGRTYSALGSHERAFKAFEQCATIRALAHGAEHRAVGEVYLNVGLAHWQKKRFADMKKFCLMGYKIYAASFPKNHPSLAEAANNLALALKENGELEEAEKLNLAAIEVREKQARAKHQLGMSLNNLGDVYGLQGRFAEAERSYFRAIEVLRKTLGEYEPYVAVALENLARTYAEMGEWAKAFKSMNESRRILRHHVQFVLPYLNDQDQLNFLNSQDRRNLDVAMSIAAQAGQDQELGKLAAEWALNAKGLAHEASALLSVRARADTRLTPLLASLRRTRIETANLTVGGIPDGDQRLVKLDQLNRADVALAGELEKAINATFGDPWTSLGEVRAQVPADGVLIEIIRHNAYHSGAKAQQPRFLPPRYLAVAIPPAGTGHPEVIDLGEAKPIDDAVKEFRQAMDDAITTPVKQGRIHAVGEPDAEKDLRDHTSKLTTLLLAKLQPRVATAKHWIVSPDGPLWLIPWSAIPWPGEPGKYAIEKVNVSHVVSGRTLLPPKHAVAGTQPLLIAGPDFDLGAKQVQEQTHELLRGGAASDDGASLFTLRGLKFHALPGTLDEVAGIVKSAEQAFKDKPKHLIKNQALEGVVKTVHRPRLLTLSTHGFFLDDQGAFKGKLPSNPLLRCGLALAGANRAAEERPAGIDDGILTGLEIVAMDLRGTELVVLSACETGLGTVHEGEGVMGLRQAFHLAGAQAVVASLWHVPDRDTATLMKYFFDNLAKGQPRPEAFRNAQVARIRERRETPGRDGAAHPFYWAAFNLTGR